MLIGNKFSRTDCGKTIIHVIKVYKSQVYKVNARGSFLPINGNAPDTVQSRKMDKVVDLFGYHHCFFFFLVIIPDFHPGINIHSI